MVNTCLLYGAKNWVNINILMILITFTLFAVMFALSSIFSGRTREKIREAARSEVTQGFLSIIIIVVLATTAIAVCGISSSISSTLTHQAMDPFQYSEYYIGNLSTNTGLNLLTDIYSTSVSYAIEAQVLQSAGALLNSGLSTAIKAFQLGYDLVSFVNLGISAVIELNVVFTSLSNLYMGIIAPLVVIVIGMLFLQFLVLPLLQYTAFSVILPAAIALRSISFLGVNLKAASNTVLAAAIAGYIVYPLMVSFNSYAISWIFSASNPSSQYIGSTYIIPSIPISTYFSEIPATTTSTASTFFSQIFHSTFLSSFVTSAFSTTGILISPQAVVLQAQTIINRVSQFLFAGLVMFVMDVAVTLGFAMGLSKALNSGVEGAGTFWSGI